MIECVSGNNTQEDTTMYRVVTRVTKYDERDGICGYKSFLVGTADSYAEAAAIRDREIGENYGGEIDCVVTDETGHRVYHSEPFCGPIDTRCEAIPF